MLAELICPSFFGNRSDVLLWLLAGGGIALLVFGADRAVSAAARLAASLGLSKVIIGATIVSLGTTTPEAVVSVKAAWEGNAGLALGNGVGSIICDTALIFGLGCVICRLPLDRFVLHRHGRLQLTAGVLLTATVLVLWAFSGDMQAVVIPRTVGGLYLVLLIAYLYLSVRWSRQHPQILPTEAVKAAGPTARNLRASLGILAVLVIGLALIVGGSELLLGSVREICFRLEVPPAVIAVTLVAFGTSLPELVTAIAAIAKGHRELLLGNIIGADILNVLFVIGASAVAQPLKVEPLFIWLLLPTMMLVLILFRLMIFTRGKTFPRWQGIPLLVIYVLFTVLTIRYGTMR